MHHTVHKLRIKLKSKKSLLPDAQTVKFKGEKLDHAAVGPPTGKNCVNSERSLTKLISFIEGNDLRDTIDACQQPLHLKVFHFPPRQGLDVVLDVGSNTLFAH